MMISKSCTYSTRRSFEGSGKKNAGDFYRPYASNFAYNAAGAVMSMRLGNGKFETTHFNSRLQPIQIGLGSSVSDHGLLKLDYTYGTTKKAHAAKI